MNKKFIFNRKIVQVAVVNYLFGGKQAQQKLESEKRTKKLMLNKVKINLFKKDSDSQLKKRNVKFI